MNKKTIRIGLDIGGTKIAAVATNSQQQPLAQAVYPTNSATPNVFIHGVANAISDILCQAEAHTADIAAIGVGIPGQVNQQTGHIHQAVNLNLDNFPLRTALQQQYDCSVRIENDVAAAAIGAYHHLQQTTPTLHHIAYIGIGTGLAAGLILNGRLYRGANGMAGEIGHVMVEPGGALCNCGARGCLETIVAGPAIARQAAEFLPVPIAADDVYTAAQKNVQQAVTLVQRVTAFLAQAIQWLMMAYDVEKVVLGGGVANVGALFLDPILQTFARLRHQSPLAQAMLPNDKITLLPSGYNPGLWGAVHLAEQAVFIP
ncbi:MAG: ROK family protein [Chloroflexi bacterium]|nr:ROK family protein [Chloroflexota bacterium]